MLLGFEYKISGYANAAYILFLLLAYSRNLLNLAKESRVIEKESAFEIQPQHNHLHNTQTNKRINNTHTTTTYAHRNNEANTLQYRR